MSVDVQRVTESVVYLNGLWLPLVWIVVCFVYLWQVCWARGERVGAESHPLFPFILSGSARCGLVSREKFQTRMAFS